MRLKCVTGAPCSGKSTYVQNNSGENDIVYDYDRLLQAISKKNSHEEPAETHAIFLNKIRFSFIRVAKEIEDDAAAWIICCKPSEAIRQVLGDDCEYIHIDKTKEEILQQLDESDRPNKEEEKERIERYFEEERMAIKPNREYRNTGAFEVDEENMVIGYASTFEAYPMMEIDGVTYYERIDRNAFENADMSDVVFLRDHEGRVLARTKNGSVQVWTDDHGLAQRTNLGLTGASREMLEDIKTGNYTQMSFSFVVDADHFDKETHTRVIDRIKKVYDISAVAFPANPYTEIGLSARDYFDGVIEMERAERLEAERKERARQALMLKLKILTGGTHGN